MPHLPKQSRWHPLSRLRPGDHAVVEGDARRHRLAHLMVVRRYPHYRRLNLVHRSSAQAVVAVVCLFSASRGLGFLLLVPAAVASALEISRLRRQRPTPPWLSAHWLLASYALVFVGPCVVTDLPVLLRIASLAAAMVVLCSVTTGILVHPFWYDPGAREPAVASVLRRLAGPLTAAGSAAIVLTGPWPAELLPAVWAMALLPLVSGARVWNLDHSLRHAISLIREEGQQGRDQILREIHGALSTELRQLEQYARDYRDETPSLYELAVNANSSLRETLTLADESRDTSTTPDTLLAPVLTLARAEGASATARIEVEYLHAQDREIARYVLNELAGESLRAGASVLDVGIAQHEDQVVVEVTDNAPSEHASAFGSGWSASGPLAVKLAAHAGSLARRPARARGSHTTWAHWQASR